MPGMSVKEITGFEVYTIKMNLSLKISRCPKMLSITLIHITLY